MNDGTTDLEKFNNIKHFTVRLNIRVINDVRTAMKTFRAEWRYSIQYRVLDLCLFLACLFKCSLFNIFVYGS